MILKGYLKLHPEHQRFVRTSQSPPLLSTEQQLQAQNLYQSQQQQLHGQQQRLHKAQELAVATSTGHHSAHSPLSLPSLADQAREHHPTAASTIAVATATGCTMSNNAVVAATTSNIRTNKNYNKILDVIGGAGVGSLTASEFSINTAEPRLEPTAGAHLIENFNTKKYYHPLYAHGVCRWPSCELALEDVASFVK